MEMPKIPKHPTHAVYLKDNWYGEGNYYLLAYQHDGEFYSHETGNRLPMHEGDEILRYWELCKTTNDRSKGNIIYLDSPFHATYRKEKADKMAREVDLDIYERRLRLLRCQTHFDLYDKSRKMKNITETEHPFYLINLKKKADEMARESTRKKQKKEFNDMSLESYLNNKYEGEK